MSDRVILMTRSATATPLSSSSSSSLSSYYYLTADGTSSSTCSSYSKSTPSHFMTARSGGGSSPWMPSSSSSSPPFSRGGGGSVSGGLNYMKTEHRDLWDVRILCEDQRKPLEHLRPPQLIKGAIRVTVQQSATIFSQYMNDQLKQDMLRDEKVQKGELTPRQADEEAEEWSEKEWPKRWEGFPAKLATAYIKYHAVTAVMRVYEYIASRYLDMVQLDKLTLDTFASARRREKRGESASMLEVAQECWNANVISYLADYSVHQIILAFGYYVYIRDRRHKRSSTAHSRRSTRDDNKGAVSAATTSHEVHAGSLVLSFVKKSTILALSRVICLAFASVGGAIGSALLPGGWGTLVGINMGDGMGLHVTEEFVLTPPSHKDEETQDNQKKN